MDVKRDEDLPAVSPVFEVRVHRRTRLLVEGGSTIEAAADEGEVLAVGRTQQFRELELELKEGSLGDLLALAARWRQRWHLCVGSISKASRGHRLASGEAYGPPVTATTPAFARKPRVGEFAAAALDSCLHQVLGNAGEILQGSRADEHVHQLRVGIRRLRTLLRELPVLADDAKRVEPALVSAFRGLGEHRDRNHVLSTISPRIEAAGGAPLHVPAGFHEGADPGGLVREDAFQEALLHLLARAQELRTDDAKGLRRELRGRLDNLLAHVTRDGAKFERLPPWRHHRVRKRLKRLRYLGEFAGPLFPAREVRRFMAILKPAQDALGLYNDEVMAEQLYGELVDSDPAAQFGLDWLRAHRPAEAKACRRELRRLRSVDPFWHRR